jgi:splicing factor 3A subunit 2
MQYLLFAADPYETIGFKIPNLKIDKSEGRFFSNWDKDGKTFTLQVCQMWKFSWVHELVWL